ncbi:alpha/beta fold hydrolase [Arthrobacter crystallopoietes]|uniref:alpha/beta fold hydrolase n=1 Tax=Crystallibacter crystallopoietes TaxID=37928 RepID=UPI001ABE73E5|nr:alpha/beta fold hydrolase [Arthrobacter crystallopoietes]QTG80296.1 alpha/beta fold hydrolase [Arthrobacter crystallopoietes]
MSTRTIAPWLTPLGEKSLFIETTGSGPDVVLVHGLGGNTSFYEPLAAALNADYRVTRYDFNGHGRSPLAGEVSLEALAEELAAVIELQTAGRRAHVVGHSMGTLVVQQLAATRPDLVDSLVLLGAVREQPPAAKEATRVRATLVREQGMAAVAGTIATGATADHAAGNPLLRPFVREMLLGQDAEAYAQACEALAGARNPDLSAITAKTLLLTGSEDKVSTPAANTALAAELPNASAHVAPGTGHWTVPEAPEFVNGAVLEFLAETTSAPAAKPKTCACSHNGCSSNRRNTITVSIRKTA